MCSEEATNRTSQTAYSSAHMFMTEKRMLLEVTAMERIAELAVQEENEQSCE